VTDFYQRKKNSLSISNFKVAVFRQTEEISFKSSEIKRKAKIAKKPIQPKIVKRVPTRSVRRNSRILDFRETNYLKVSNNNYH
jgi:hypothetical protein